MTLLPCRECGQQVSTEAEACPHCGAPVPTRSAVPPQQPGRASYPPTVPRGGSDSRDWVESHRKSSNASMWVLGGFAALIFLGMCSAVGGGNSSTASSSATPTDFTAIDTMVVASVDTIAEATSSATSEGSVVVDDSSTSMFFQSHTSSLERTRTAKVVRTQVPVYQEGEPAFEF